MRLKSTLRFIFGVVVVGLLVNLISDAIDAKYPSAHRIAIQVVLILVAAWLLILVGGYAVSALTAGRYAVEALILNARNELLLYNHPHHKRMLPPGGRIRRTEFPNDALQARLEARLGLNPRDYRFEPHFHHGLSGGRLDLGEVRRFAGPFLVQRELHRQRTFVRFHYDLIYVIRLIDDDQPLVAKGYEPTLWVDLPVLTAMVAQGRTFPDVLDAYERILAVLVEDVT